MSNRDSLGFGELIPQDVVDIFAQEKHSKRGRKKRSRSLRRALAWLKRRKRKDLSALGLGLGLGPALDLALDGRPAGHPSGHKGGQKSGRHALSQAVPKRDDDDKTPSTPLFQENVFVEASRPKYLENLHSEAREGLKMMQEEETNNGMEFRDNESTISTMTVQTDGEGFTTDSTMGDTSSVVSVKSSVSTRSFRSGLTRQESTFRPLSSDKKTKTRRRHKRTVVGIPQHVQRELGMDRAGWSLTQKFDEEQLYNGETDDSSTTDGPERAAGSQKGGSPNLPNISVTHPLNKEQLKQLGDHGGHRDRLGPWMAAANSLHQAPPSAVMSMSPQAAYMSKIIPNAVLPPSIEVVEISRGQSRNSVRTVSKSSLLLSSPSPSRASSRSSNVTSASRYNPVNMSDSSCWSNSESSETLVSDSSTISRTSDPNRRRSQEREAHFKEDKISVHSSISKASKCTSNGKQIINGERVKKEGAFVRSLSVMKSKRAPPPPSRSYSLHNKMKRRSRDLAELKINAGESSIYNLSASGAENETDKHSPVPTRTRDSPGYTADTSSLEDSLGSASFSPIRSQVQALKEERAAKVEQPGILPLENKRSKVISPSSGYSSQDGASSQIPKQSNKKGILAKLHRFFPGSSSHPQPDTTVDIVNVSPSVRALRELFNIPPPPKVHAPPAPPPEVWAHSKRSFELLLGPPAPDNLDAIIKKNPKDRRPRHSPSTSAESSVKSLVIERKHKKPALESVNRSLNVLETKKDQESGIVSADTRMENRLAQPTVHFKGNSKVTEQVEEARVSDIINGMLVKAVERRDGRLEAVREEEAKKTSAQTPETTVVSPESSWPPPPPPPVGFNGPDEMDLPLPPPPVIGEGGLVIPFQVPPERSSPGGDSSCTTVLSGVTPSPPSIPPPPPYTAPPPPHKAVSPSTIKKVTPLPSVKEETPLPPPKEVTPPLPSVKEETPPQPPEEVTPAPPPPKEVTLPSVKGETLPPPPKEVTLLPAPKRGTLSPAPSKGVSPSPLKEASPPLVVDGSVPLVAVVSSSPQPPTEISTKLTQPQSIPPSPPLPSQSRSEQEIDPPQGSLLFQSETSPVSSYSILTPPQSIPPPPPIQLLRQPQVGPQNTDGPATREPPHSALSEVSIRPALEISQEPAISPPVNIPSPGLASIEDLSSPAITENQGSELSSDTVVQEDPIPDLTPSTNGSPETPEAQKPPEVTLRQQQPGKPVSTSSASGEAPQKPIRRSLILINATSPLPTSSPPSPPPPTVTAQPALPNSMSLLVQPASSSAVVSPTKKSPTATTGSPSMNLQEAIRLRTVARSKAFPSSRLSLNSPTSPGDFRKSPSCTASFVFSKINTKVAIETKPALEPMGTVVKKLEESSATKGDKVPPPVAKKPKAKGNGTEASDGTEQTAAQEALQDSITDAAEKTDGTAGTVEGGTPST
ncbi:uncharacterized protein AB9W97_006456 isoform 2-T4 [Spinachia spinachia]